MSKTSDGPKLNPRFASSDNPATFADDLTFSSEFFAARSFQHYTTVVALVAATADMDVLDVALAENAPGAWFRFNGSTWDMHGVARFADSSARATALAAPQTGWMSRLDTERFDRRYNGSGWLPWGAAEFPIIPSGVSGTGVSLSGGTVVFSNATAITVNGVHTSDFDDYELDFSETAYAGGGDVILQPTIAGTAVATNFAGSNIYANGAGAASTVANGSTSFRLTLGANTRAGTKATLFGPNLAQPTGFNGQGWGNGSSGFVFTLGAWLNDNAQYDGFKITFPTSGGTGTVKVKGISKIA